MSRTPEDFPPGPPGSRRPPPPGAQGASRGGFRPDEAGAGDQQPFGQYGSSAGSGRQSRSGGGPRFLGLPVKLIYAIGAAIIGLVFIGAICGSPSKPGTVAGQVLGYTTDRTLTNLAGAQLTLTGAGQTYTTTSTEVPDGAEGEAAYNYRFDEVPPGDYKLTVTPPPGAAYQPEEDLTFKVRSGQLFPQSVMLLADGVQKPRPLAANELQSGEAGGYVNDRGERVVYRQGSGLDASDALLMYLLWRNPPGWGYGAPPVIVRSPGGSSTTSNYRVAEPPSTSRSGQTVTQRKPETPGQGSTRPSGSTGVTGAGPNTSGSSGSSTQAKPSSGSSSSSSSGSRTGSTTITRPSAPSQGSTRPSSSFTSPSRSSAPSRSSGGGRR